jgi:hypothetical protein
VLEKKDIEMVPYEFGRFIVAHFFLKLIYLRFAYINICIQLILPLSFANKQLVSHAPIVETVVLMLNCRKVLKEHVGSLLLHGLTIVCASLGLDYLNDVFELIRLFVCQLKVP